MDFHKIEYAGFRSWPAAEEHEFDGVVLRYTQGYTKRANSANIIHPLQGDYTALVKRCEFFFAQKNHPCTFRLPSFCHNPGLDQYLDNRGYALIDPSLILSRPLQKYAMPEGDIISKDHQQWLSSFCTISETELSKHSIHESILKRIKGKVLMAVLIENGVEVACGLGVISDSYFGLFDIVTQRNYRKKGYGTKLLQSMLNWAVSNGATQSYIQVTANNQAALTLYKKLGYQECYQYCYRIKTAGS